LERFLEDVPVGGLTLAGLQIEGNGIRPDPSNLSVLLPLHTRTLLCVKVNTIDGRYSGRAEYDVSASPPGQHALPYNSAFRSRLLQYKADEVAILAELKNRCTDSELPEALLVAAWAGRARPRVIVLVNGNSADRIELNGAQCSEIQSDAAVAFDWMCKAPLVTGKRRLTVRRFYFDDSKTVHIRISVP
jgi:hypothetical protein